MRTWKILVLLFLPFGTWAQLKSISMEEATIGLYTNLRAESIYNIQWRPGKQEYNYISKDTLVAGYPAKKEKTTLLTLNELNSLLVPSKPLDAFPYGYQWVGTDQIQFVSGNFIVRIDVAAKKLVYKSNLPEDAAHLEFHTGSGRTACTVGNNIYVSQSTGAPLAITNDTETGIVNGTTVHREEFGIQKGLFWSPQGNYLAFYKKDESAVADYPLVKTSTRIAEEVPIKYPMAGMTSETVHLWIHNISTNQQVMIQTGTPEDQYLTAVSWDPSEKYVYIGILNRAQNHLKLNQYEIATGKLIKTLFEEKNAKYVEPENPLTFLPNDPAKFIWQSEKDGFNHLYLYNTEGNQLKQLTSGSWEVTELLGFDAKSEHLFFQSTAVSPLERHVYKLHLKSGKTTQLTQQAGTHHCVVSEDGKFILDQYSSISEPNTQLVLDGSGKTIDVLVKAKEPLEAYDMPVMEFVELTAADGKTKLYGRIIKPKNMPAGTPLPVMVYVYGGPHAQMVTNTRLGGASLWEYYMAQQGYIVFTLDNRGSAHRGFEFESVIHRQLGQAEMADQLVGIEYLKTLPYVDQGRIGVYGWSFGGFMATSLITNYPEIFKVAVAGGPVIDWKYYEVMYGERYMDTPDENPEGYQKTALVSKAADLKGRLLIIHGAQDPVVVWQHSLTFVNECVNKNKQVDYFVYPSDEHNVRGRKRVHLNTKITDYFNLHLSGK